MILGGRRFIVIVRLVEEKQHGQDDPLELTMFKACTTVSGKYRLHGAATAFVGSADGQRSSARSENGRQP
jgi:hypothetical protein